MKTPHWAIDHEPPPFDIVELRSSDPVARKEHTCSHCKRTIPVGDRYNNAVYILDGEFRHDKTCGYCMSGYDEGIPLDEPDLEPDPEFDYDDDEDFED